MRWDDRRTCADASWTDALARFERRPATWMRPFLQLAVHPDAAGSPWYRLGRADRHHVASLHWRPRASSPLFVRFSGALGLQRTDDGFVLTLGGSVDGGDPMRNAEVLGSLLDLLAEALSHPPGEPADVTDLTDRDS